MPTLNVFKLARNVDYTLKPTSELETDGNLQRKPSKKPFTKKSKNQDFPAHPTYTRVDPDLIMSSPERKPSTSASIMTISHVHNNNTQKSVSQEVKSEPQLLLEQQPLQKQLQQQQIQEKLDQLHEEQQHCHHHEEPQLYHAHEEQSPEHYHPHPQQQPPHPQHYQPPEYHVNGHRHYRNGNQDADPELYRRLIQEAPFLTTTKEPAVDLDETDGLSSRRSSRKQSSSAKSVSKTESSVSIATFNLELNWVDQKLIKQGREFIRRNFLGVMLAHFIGLAFLLAVRPVACILLRNGKFHKPAKRNNWHLYLLLLRRLKSWYDKGDFTDVDDPTTADILAMRKSIYSAGKNFRKFVPPPAQELLLDEAEGKLLTATKLDLDQLKEVPMDMKDLPKIFATVNPDVPWSQYDLAIVQFAFFGFISLFPKTFGIYNLKGIQGFIHLWAVIGHLLGLENRFNLCKPENFDEDTNHKILKHVFIFSFKIADNGMMRMLQLMCAGSKWFTVFVTRLKLVLLFMTREVALVKSTKNMFVLIRWYDKVQYYGYRFWNAYLVRLFFLRMFANLCARLVLAAAFGVYLGQVRWRKWRAKRKPPQQVVVFPNSISLELSRNSQA